MAAREGSVSKFSGLDSQGVEGPYPYRDRWSLQRTSGPDRLVVAPSRRRHVDVLLALARCLQEPFGILYVLVVPRTGEHAAGRYQNPSPSSRVETEAFVERFRDYLEGDGRHHLWLMSLPDVATLVYDNHDLLYAYGPLDRFRAALAGLGFREGQVAIPAPHQHCYHQQFDEAEREVMRHWEWRQFPLGPDDDP